MEETKATAPIRKFQICTSAEGVEPEVWELTLDAHRYDAAAFMVVVNELDSFSVGHGTKDVGGVSLTLAIWILASRHGPDAAKRIHLLEQLGAEFNFSPRIYGGTDEDDEGEKKKKVRKGPPLDWLYMTYKGLRFRVADFITSEWRDEILQRLELHREYASQSRTTVTSTSI